jgi:hypothetical protein
MSKNMASKTILIGYFGSTTEWKLKEDVCGKDDKLWLDQVGMNLQKIHSSSVVLFT